MNSDSIQERALAKPIITIKNLVRHFGEIKAVDNITFEVREGELFAFLGQNGAGKSTTINILCTLLKKNSGEIVLSGTDIDIDPAKIRRDIGVVFQGSVLDKKLSVLDNLRFRAAYYGLSKDAVKKRIAYLSELFDLDELLKRPYGKLSGGQRRRVDIVRGMLNEPKILFLDEPTTGLDPQSRRMVWDVLTKVRKETGMTIFLTTHYMEEAAKADYVVIIDEGHISAKGTPVELKNEYSTDFLKVFTKESAEWNKIFAKRKFEYADGMYKVRVADSKDAIKLIESIKEMLTDFEVVKGDMDDVFLNVTGKTLREAN